MNFQDIQIITLFKFTDITKNELALLNNITVEELDEIINKFEEFEIELDKHIVLY